MESILNNVYNMTAFSQINFGTILMWAISFTLLYLGIKKEFEPLLLVPIAFGMLIANFPGGGMGIVPGEMVMTDVANHKYMDILEIGRQHGVMNLLYYGLIKTGLIPPIIFMGIGALIDFGPMLRNLRLALFGAAAQIGIFLVIFGAIAVGFTPKEAASLGIIGGADGPTAIYTCIKLAPHLLGPIAVAAYSYMALVPIIIPMVAKLTMTKKEFLINMKEQDRLFPPKTPMKNIKAVKIIFPIVLGTATAIFVPTAVPLVGMLLFGNLVKECGTITERLAEAASGPILNTATIFLGLTVGATMTAETFLKFDTIMILVGGFFAFSLSVAGGIVMVKIVNIFSKKKINPLIGGTGLSAVPMSSRVANELALKYDKTNHILQYAMASNVSGVIGSAVAAGVLIAFLS